MEIHGDQTSWEWKEKSAGLYLPLPVIPWSLVSASLCSLLQFPTSFHSLGLYALPSFQFACGFAEDNIGSYISDVAACFPTANNHSLQVS